MSISVIIPTYNGIRFLGKTIESVLEQTYVDWELLIVDDGSTDTTLELALCYAERDPRIRVIRAANGNVATARNNGFSEASAGSEYIVFLDHDDLWEPDTLETLVRLLEQSPTAVAAYGLARFINAQGQPCRIGVAEESMRERETIDGNRVVPHPYELPITFEVLVYSNCLFTPGQALIRRSALEAIGPLDPDMAPADDYDLWLRLCARGPMVGTDRVVLGFRQHESNQSRRVAVMQEKLRLVRRKMFDLPELTPEQRRMARRVWRIRFRHQAQIALWKAHKCARDGNIILAVRHAMNVFTVIATFMRQGRSRSVVFTSSQAISSEAISER